MSILSLIQDASTVLGIERPDQVIGSTEQDHIELAALANEMGDRLCRSGDWQALTRLRTETIDDRPNFARDLQPDFDHFLKDGSVRSSEYTGAALRHVVNLDEWLELTMSGVTCTPQSWTILGNQIAFSSAPANGTLIKYYYISNLWARSAAGQNQHGFTSDTDTYRLNERTLRLSIVAQWKMNKGLDFQTDAGIAAQALAEDLAREKGPRGIKIGRPSWPGDVEFALPGLIVP